ncbi:anti-sigma regulatory factor [Pseudoduganella albidiflava]|uniref:Anti-sigma regulatory factor n=2 Tax=Pseudoduganella albidiflava TaxID=321983 RepID=A0AA87Y2K2_9BURK|nr:anti-sigma regulatory factor [Pseudoduganella albidiflava]GGY69236.1 anti-sigma regulatory factor [Pseudoduganella albidiflava]
MSHTDADTQHLSLRSDEDVVRLRQCVRELMIAAGFSLLEQTKMITAASELARNTLRYGGGGEAHVRRLLTGSRKGIGLAFIDQGPGIADIDLALTEGFTTRGGMGVGLSGARRLADEFDIASAPGQGTTVQISKWKSF